MVNHSRAVFGRNVDLSKCKSNRGEYACQRKAISRILPLQSVVISLFIIRLVLHYIYTPNADTVFSSD